MKALNTAKRALASISLIVVASVLVACSSQSAQPHELSSADFATSSSGAMSEGASEMAQDMAAIESDSSYFDEGLTGTVAPTEAAIIKNGSMRLQVDDPHESLDGAEVIANDLGGSVENRYIFESEDGRWIDANLQLKVPSDQFEKAFDELEELGKVLEDQRSDTDVTLERTDLRARVDALEISIDRLLTLLKDASKTSDLLQVETALAERQQELDSLKAQLTVLEDQVSFSRISISFTTDQAIPGGPDSFWEGLLVGLDSIAKAASALVVIAGVALPWVVAIGVITLVVVWIILSSIRRRKTKS